MFYVKVNALVLIHTSLLKTKNPNAIKFYISKLVTVAIDNAVLVVLDLRLLYKTNLSIYTT